LIVENNPDTKAYVLPTILSVCLHAGVVILTLISWPSMSEHEPVAAHIQARILDQDMLKQIMAAKDPSQPVTPEPEQTIVKPPVVTEQQTEQEKLAEQRRQAEAEQQKQREAERKLEAEQARQDAIALKKKQKEEKKQQVEKELAAKKAREEKERDRRLAEQKKQEEEAQAERERRAEQKRREEEKLVAERKKAELESRLKQQREKARLEKIQQEELALSQQAAEFEKALLAKAQAQESAKRQRLELSELEKFTVQIKMVVEQAWILPPGDNSGLQATLNLRLAPTGDLVEATVTKSSGNRAYDISLKSAAYAVNRYPVTKDRQLFEREFRNMYLNFITE